MFENHKKMSQLQMISAYYGGTRHTEPNFSRPPSFGLQSSSPSPRSAQPAENDEEPLPAIVHFSPGAAVGVASVKTKVHDINDAGVAFEFGGKVCFFPFSSISHIEPVK